MSARRMRGRGGPLPSRRADFRPPCFRPLFTGFSCRVSGRAGVFQ